MMAKKKSGNGNNFPKISYMFQSLHEAVYNDVFDDVGATRFHKTNSDIKSNNVWSSNIMGKFECPNSKCETSRWTSKHVAIKIRGYPNNAYNAVVFNQRCQSCNNLGNMIVDEDSYVERVGYRLRRWAGVEVERPVYGMRRDRPPHRRDLCEGCKAGCCREDAD